MAKDISRQILRLFDAYKIKEAELLSDSSLCICEARATVDKLKLKAVMHHGEAVFSKVGQFQKLAKRMVKSPSKNYRNLQIDTQYELQFPLMLQIISTVYRNSTLLFCSSVEYRLHF